MVDVPSHDSNRLFRDQRLLRFHCSFCFCCTTVLEVPLLLLLFLLFLLLLFLLLLFLSLLFLFCKWLFQPFFFTLDRCGALSPDNQRTHSSRSAQTSFRPAKALLSTPFRSLGSRIRDQDAGRFLLRPNRSSPSIIARFTQSQRPVQPSPRETQLAPLPIASAADYREIPTN